MHTAERRAQIVSILKNTNVPVLGRELAAQFAVSRQIIVQDLAVIRASSIGVISTSRGYLIQQETACAREFKVRHFEDRAEEELNLIADCGGWVRNVSISHKIYGRITAEIDIRSRQDTSEFISALNSGKSSLLSSSTSGYHYHLVEAANIERLELIEQQLKQAGFLASFQPWERNH